MSVTTIKMTLVTTRNDPTNPMPLTFGGGGDVSALGFSRSENGCKRDKNTRVSEWIPQFHGHASKIFLITHLLVLDDCRVVLVILLQTLSNREAGSGRLNALATQARNTGASGCEETAIATRR